MGLRKILGKVGRGWCPLVGVAVDSAKNEEERYAIRNTAILFGSVFFIASMIAAHVGLKRYDNLMDQALIKADANRDGIVSEEEWAKVYGGMGIEYDIGHYLSTKMLERYLKN